MSFSPPSRMRVGGQRVQHRDRRLVERGVEEQRRHAERDRRRLGARSAALPLRSAAAASARSGWQRKRRGIVEPAATQLIAHAARLRARHRWRRR